MNGRTTRAVTRAASSSAVVPAVRRVVEGSILCAAAAAVLRYLWQTRDRMRVGLAGGTSGESESRGLERLDALAANSRVLGALSSILMAPTVAAREATAGHLLDPFLHLDSPARFRLGAWVIVVAAVTHSALLALLGVPVHALGWSIRVGLVVAGVIVLRRPETLAAAWRDKLTP